MNHLFTLLLVSGLWVLGTPARGEKPNIIFMFSDDHACNAISAYPGGLFDEIAPTPNIDRIAREGMLFENSFCANSICGPSRANILTGKHSHLNGFLDNNSSYFDGRQQTFPQLLRNTGYQVAMIGKWHLHSHPVGFDFWRILPGQGAYYNPDFIEMDGSRKRYEGHCNDLVMDFGLKWMKEDRDKDKPFVAMIQFKAPHRNWSAAERHLNLFKGVTMPEPETLFDDYANRSKVLAEHAMGIDKHMYWGHDMKFHGENLFPGHFSSGIANAQYKRMTEVQKKAWDAVYQPENEEFIAAMKAGRLSKKDIVRWKYQRYIKDYLRCVASIDDNVGRVLDYLEEEGGAVEDTIVIYTSDQGFFLGDHGWYDKRFMYEESLRMPFIIRYPREIEAGSVCEEMMLNVDFAPTWLDCAGIDIPDHMQGRSCRPLLNGETPGDWQQGIYYRYWMHLSHHNVAAHYGVRTHRYKLIYYYGDACGQPNAIDERRDPEWELFDLQEDPCELNSVYGDPAYCEVASDLTRKLHELQEKLGDQRHETDTE